MCRCRASFVRRLTVGAVLAAAVVLATACASEPVATDPLARGAQVYRALDCASCHEPGFFGLGRRTGPPLEHVGTISVTRKEGTAAAAYLRESVTDPGSYVVSGFADVMPRGLDRRLSPADLDALIAYLLSLK